MEILEVDSFPVIESSEIALDIETTRNHGKDSDPYRDRIVSLQVSDGKKTWIMRNNFISAASMLINPDIKKIGQNLSFDLRFLKHQLGGIEITNVHDTLLAERLLTSGIKEVSNGLDAILSRRVGVYTDKTIRDQFSQHSGGFTREQLEYMAKDVLYLPEIRRQQLEEIGKAGMGRVLALENAVVPVVVQMGLDGVGFNRELWTEHLAWFEQKKVEIKHRVVSYLPDAMFVQNLFDDDIDIGLNLSSTEQVRAALAKLGLHLPDTREATLQMMLETIDIPQDSPAFRLIRDVLEWRGWEKLIGYGYHDHINPITGKIHASWNQLAAQTGRFSCSDPNLQQVKRPEKGEPNLRAAFVPDEGRMFVICDFGQQEPRILAQISGDERMIQAANATDMYTAVGPTVYNREITKKDGERQRLKIGMLGHFYGAYPKKLARVLGISIEEATQFKALLNGAFPKAARWGDNQEQNIVQRGYMVSMLGRRCWIREALGAKKDDAWHFANQARNGPIQMTAADIGKEAMRRFYRWTIDNNYDAHISLAVHDELVVSCLAHQAEEVKYSLVGAMQSAMEEICPDVRAEVEPLIAPVWSKG